jgi:hypothetical protein
MEFGLVIAFIYHLQLVTKTIITLFLIYTIYKALHIILFSLFLLIFTSL